ncbi:thiol:disulfide interchange protein [Patiriisocius marinus]|uniref:Thiol:disulfide interchange protein n=1 Tax=Patiriisocius marinus TaxID=1397112 RepID=A0A5J4J0Y9_9FLAO|nr:TlpA disulfide reductase family protein [Patiriisocius marinus]GER59481.1 thiol:disulfide interchange protein [Patiriisocius marinus]
MKLLTTNTQFLIIGLCLLLITVSCQEKNTQVDTTSTINGYSISGSVANSNATMVYLVDTANKRVDSSKVTNNSFLLKGSIGEPNMYNLVFDTSTPSYAILLENMAFNVLMNDSDVLITGGDLNTKLATYKRDEAIANAQRLSVLKKFSLATITDKELLFSLDSISQLETEYAVSFIEKNKDNVLSSMAIAAVSLPLEDLIALTERTKNAKNSQLINTLTTTIAVLQKAEDDKIAAEEKVAAKRKVYRVAAPQFSGESLSGTNLALTSVLKGNKAVLVDFWASWCKPCRMVTPEIKYIYQQYNKLGFDIITVSEDRTQAAWRQGIQEDNMLDWNHIYDNQMTIASQFGARAIPHMVLIDKDGKIIKDKISVNQLKKELAIIFK